MTFSILTFGCKVNQGESENIASSMVERGFELLEGKEAASADVVIVNSCSVTAESDRKLRQCIHRVRRENENCIIILTGCMPQAFPQVAKSFEEVQIIVGNGKKSRIPEMLGDYLKNGQRIFDVGDIKEEKEFKEKFRSSKKDRFRAFLKIEDGCDKFCSYCIIPYARGRVRSKPLEYIKSDVLKLCENGYKEIVLTGINLSSYGKDLNCSLEDAVKLVCDIDGVKRVRLSSLEPDLVTEKFLTFLTGEEKFCPQFHLSLQSGSDKILKKMRRRYTRSDYLDLVQRIKSKFPLATFTTDIMVGFSGETEQDFQDSLDIISRVGFLKVHVFPYSVRPGTLAADFEGKISRATKAQRVQKMIDFSQKTGKIVIESFLGQGLDVLFESVDEEGFYRGYTTNYIPVKAKSSKDVRGEILKTFISSAKEDFCEGKILN